MSVGARMKALRKQQHMTLKALGVLVHLSPSFLCDIEQGRTQPSISRLEAIAAALGTTAAYLLGEDSCAQRIPQGVADTVHQLLASGEGAELIQAVSDFDHWSTKDKQELLAYLRVKQQLRNTETGA